MHTLRQEKYQNEIRKLKEQWKSDRKKRWEAEWKTQKNLKEAAELSADRLKDLGNDEVAY